MGKRVEWKAAVFSILMAMVTTLNMNAVEEHLHVTGSNIIGWGLRFLFHSLLFYIAAYTLKRAIGGVRAKGSLSSIRISWKREALRMWLAWMPYLLIFFPGLANYDTVNQINDVFDGIAPVPFGFMEGQETVTAFLNAHHPVAVTLLFSFFIHIGLFLGNAGYGIFFYCVIQSALAAGIFSFVICDLEHIGAIGIRSGRWIRRFYTWMPFIPFYTICMLKNTLHSLLTVLFVYGCYVYLKQDGRVKRTWWIRAILLSLALCLTQNTGIYVVLATGGIFFLFHGKDRNWILSGMLLCATVWFWLLPKIIYPAAQIFPGGRQEMLGTCFQQTARLVLEHEGELSQEDIAVVSSVLDYEKIKTAFDPSSTDPVKATYRLHATKEELHQYCLFWARMGIRYPLTYLRATLTICGVFFSPTSAIQIFDQIPKAGGVFEQIGQVMPEAVWRAVGEWYHALVQLPGMDIMFQTVLYAFWIPMFALYRWMIMDADERRSGEKEILALTPVFVNMLILLASPMDYSRYALPLIFSSPILAGVSLRSHARSAA